MDFIPRFPFRDIDFNGYSNIKNHGLIVSNRTAALVSMNGTIDWCCMPDFNSDPIFDSILDSNIGGKFSIRPYDTEGLSVSQYYLDHTNILSTEFYKDSSLVLRITDFIPVSGYSTINFPEIHRYISSPKKDTRVSINIKPNFHFGKEKYHIKKRRNGYIFQGKTERAGISTSFPLEQKIGSLDGDFVLGKNNSGWIVLLYDVGDIHRISDYKSFELMEETAMYNKNWVAQGKYPAMYNREVVRSALVLKGLFYEPTGLMVASPTSSLPESIGGERNWDYRYSWVRDIAYVIESLSLIGYKQEAIKFLYDVMERVKREGDLRTIYPINDYGRVEETVINYSGYVDSKPVRMGNGAEKQLQIDEYASLIHAVYYVARAGGTINSYLWNFVEEILKKLTTLWKRPDSTIWEYRTEPQHYTYSKVMAWAAYKKGVEMTKILGIQGPIKEWNLEANKIKEEVMKNALDQETNTFVQYYGSKHTDASLLKLPLIGFLSPDHPAIRSTVKRIEDELMTDHFLFKRYINNDGIESHDNAFIMLSFWYVEVLISLNKIDNAIEVYDDLLSESNHLNLYSEELEFYSRKFLGNFPQALSHLALIRAAVRLNGVLKDKKSSNKKYSFSIL
ncbi:MAG: glycoside hydrolase family 15 protein [Thermoplasmataceae archaeon]